MEVRMTLPTISLRLTVFGLIRTVNTEARNATACALATVAYVRGAKAATARSKAGTFEVVEVLVVGIATRRGLEQASPALYFTRFKVEERPA
jgi:hypothetical protein